MKYWTQKRCVPWRWPPLPAMEDTNSVSFNEASKQWRHWDACACALGNAAVWGRVVPLQIILKESGGRGIGAIKVSCWLHCQYIFSWFFFVCLFVCFPPCLHQEWALFCCRFQPPDSLWLSWLLSVTVHFCTQNAFGSVCKHAYCSQVVRSIT